MDRLYQIKTFSGSDTHKLDTDVNLFLNQIKEKAIIDIKINSCVLPHNSRVMNIVTIIYRD